MKSFLFVAVFALLFAAAAGQSSNAWYSQVWSNTLINTVSTPTVVDTTHGVAGLRIDNTNAQFTTFVNPFNASSTITSCHIHYTSVVGGNGDIIFNMTAAGGGCEATATFALDNGAGLVLSYANLTGGHYYINVHTVNNPNGELRANLKAPQNFAAYAVNVGNVTAARASARWTVADATPTNTVIFSERDISVPITACQAMQSTATFDPTSSTLLKDLTQTVGGVVSCAFNNFDLTSTNDTLFLAGQGRVFFQVLTAANPNGEVRGFFVQDATYVDLSSGAAVLSSFLASFIALFF